MSYLDEFIRRCSDYSCENIIDLLDQTYGMDHKLYTNIIYHLIKKNKAYMIENYLKQLMSAFMYRRLSKYLYKLTKKFIEGDSTISIYDDIMSCVTCNLNPYLILYLIKRNYISCDFYTDFQFCIDMGYFILAIYLPIINWNNYKCIFDHICYSKNISMLQTINKYVSLYDIVAKCKTFNMKISLALLSVIYPQITIDQNTYHLLFNYENKYQELFIMNEYKVKRKPLFPKRDLFIYN